MRRVLLTLLVSLPVLAEPGATNEATRRTVDAYLGSIDTPIPDARWKALGADAAPILASIASSDGLPSRRAKALHALSIVDPAQAAPLARAYAVRTDEPLVVRSAAVRVVATTVSASEALSLLRPVLDGASAPLQRRTAEALTHLGREGCRAVQAHVGGLPEDARPPFARALAQCQGAAKP